MPDNTPSSHPLGRREVVESAKKQWLFVIFSVFSILFFWPERFRFVRDIFLLFFLAWLITQIIELVTYFNDTWEDRPRWLKFFLPRNVHMPIVIPSELCNDTLATIRFHLDGASQVAKQYSDALLEAFYELLSWIFYWALLLLQIDIPKSDSPHDQQFVSLLVATPRVHRYGLLDGFNVVREPFSEPVNWESYTVPPRPSIHSALTFCLHISFCLVPKAVWECTRTQLVQKLESGLYWDIGPKNSEDAGIEWPLSRVTSIMGVEVLGTIPKKAETITGCHTYFSHLRQAWNYMDISWNDIDFAIFLGYLVTGPQAETTAKTLFSQFANLLLCQHFSRRQNIDGLKMLGIGVTLLAALIVLPIDISSKILSNVVFGRTITPRDACFSFEVERSAECLNLVWKFSELGAMFGISRDQVEKLKQARHRSAVATNTPHIRRDVNDATLVLT